MSSRYFCLTKERKSFSFCRNGIDVEGASHKQVVDLIKHSADELHLVGKRNKNRSVVFLS